MRTIDNQPEDIFLGGWNLVLGAGLILAPWYFGFRSEDIAAWNAWITGATILALAALTLMRTREGEVYAIGAAGLWSCAAPWALGFQDAAAVAQSAYNLEKLIGFDKAGKTVVIPDENSSPETRQAFLSKMGVPETADGYKLPIPPGQTDAFAKEASSWFHEQGISAKAAEGLTTKFNEYSAKAMEAQQQEFAVRSEQEFAGLKTEWGAAYDQNLELGKRAALQFIPGTAEERAATLQSLEQSLGTGKLLKLMASIGQGLGEHKMMGGEGGGGVMTPAQANQRIAELKSNRDWSSAYLSGDKSKAKELTDLIAMANPGA